MKTLLAILLLSIAVSAFAEQDDDSIAVSSVVPSVRSITKTSYGYYIDSSSGRKYAYKTSYGYRIDGIMLYRNSTGFMVQDSSIRSHISDR